MKIVITGVTGFIGGHLLTYLRSLHPGDELHGFARQSPQAARLAAEPNLLTAMHYGSLLDPASLLPALAGADVVVHLAAEMDFFPASPAAEARLLRTNVDGTRNVLLAAVRAGARRVVYCSSTEAVGPTPPFTQADEAAAQRPTSLYGRSKQQAEREARAVKRQHPALELLILRPTGVYGPRDGFSVFELMQSVNRGLLCFVPGDGAPLLMYTHVDDVCQGIRLAIHADYRPVEARAWQSIDAQRGADLQQELLAASVADAQHSSASLSAAPSLSAPASSSLYTYTISPDLALSYADWIATLSRLTGRAVPWLHVPYPLLKCATWLLAPVMNLGKARTFMWQVDTVERMKEHRNYSNQRAKQDLGYSPKYDIPSGLAQTVRYNFDHGLLTRYFISPFVMYSIIVVVLLFYLFHVLIHVF